MNTEPGLEPDTDPCWWTITVHGPFIINWEPPLPLSCPWVVEAIQDSHRYQREHGDYDEYVQCTGR